MKYLQQKKEAAMERKVETEDQNQYHPIEQTERYQAVWEDEFARRDLQEIQSGRVWVYLRSDCFGEGLFFNLYMI